MNRKVEEIFNKLGKSKFRSKFHLTIRDKEYALSKGEKVIEEHARNLINKRLKDKSIINDGKQTPMRGHPVFIAQHATGTCCRGCLCKWHHISKDKELSEKEVNYIVKIIMVWISRQMKNK